MDIAIIGAGAAAVGLLDALDPEAVNTVTVFEPASPPWRGRPDQPDLDSVLVNVPPEIMSIRFGDQAHYARWLGEHAPGAYQDERLGRPVPPRTVYGRYLEDTAERALPRFGRAQIVRAAVTGVSRDERPTVRITDGRRYAADRVVLCVGGGTPVDHYGLTGAPGFVADPYPLERTLAEILQEAAHTTGPVAWRLLPERDRERLRSGHFRTITSLASPMVPRNAATLLDLFDAGALEMLPGVEKIEAARGFRIEHAAGTRTADFLINAVNPPPHAIPRAAGSLVSSLLGQGATRHPHGGLAADPDTGRLIAGGRPDPRLYVVGDLAGGGPFLTSGIPGVAAQAHRVARSLRPTPR